MLSSRCALNRLSKTRGFIAVLLLLWLNNMTDHRCGRGSVCCWLSFAFKQVEVCSRARALILFPC